MDYRLTKYITGAGVIMTSLDSMDHYKPCVKCRENAPIHNNRSLKYNFCDTCEVKILFNKLAEYEEAGTVEEFKSILGGKYNG